MVNMVARMFRMNEMTSILSTSLLCKAEHKASCEAGLELGCGECNKMGDMESKKE